MTMSSNYGFEFLDHPADVSVHAWGSSFTSAAEGCVDALIQTMVDPSDIREIEEYHYEYMEETDSTLESILVGFLSEILYRFDTESILIKTLKLKLIERYGKPYALIGSSWGEKFDSRRHHARTEVKAITYSYLRIQITSLRVDIWIVYDI